MGNSICKLLLNWIDELGGSNQIREIKIRYGSTVNSNWFEINK